MQTGRPLTGSRQLVAPINAGLRSRSFVPFTPCHGAQVGWLSQLDPMALLTTSLAMHRAARVMMKIRQSFMSLIRQRLVSIEAGGPHVPTPATPAQPQAPGSVLGLRRTPRLPCPCLPALTATVATYQ